MTCVLSAVAALSYVTAAMGFALIAFSNGQRRPPESRWGKYTHYAYYPILLLLMALWGRTRQGA